MSLPGASSGTTAGPGCSSPQPCLALAVAGSPVLSRHCHGVLPVLSGVMPLLSRCSRAVVPGPFRAALGAEPDHPGHAPSVPAQSEWAWPQQGRGLTVFFPALTRFLWLARRRCRLCRRCRDVAQRRPRWRRAGIAGGPGRSGLALRSGPARGSKRAWVPRGAEGAGCCVVVLGLRGP